MSLTIQVTPRHDLLHVVAQGTFNLDQALQNFVTIIEAVDEHKSERILIDGRSVIGEPSVIDRFYYGEFVAELVMRPSEKRGPVVNPRFAYVLTPPVLDHSRLGETIAANRGMNIRVFDHMAEALSWLGITEEELRDIPRAAREAVS